MATESSTAAVEKLVVVAESEVAFDFRPGAKCRTVVHLRSLHPSSAVAFRVQTSAPHKFHANPPAGFLPPLSAAALLLSLRPQPHPPARFPRSTDDRFLLRATLAAGDGQEGPTAAVEGEGPTTVVKLRVAYVGPFLLRHAVDLGDASAVRGILRRQRGLLPGLNTGYIATLLRSATTSPHPAILPLLLDAGLRVPTAPEDADPTNAGWEKEELRRVAAQLGHGSVERKALHAAKVNGHAATVAALPEMGADSGVAAGLGALDVAREKGHEMNEIEILRLGEMIMTASRRGDLSRLEMLLKKRVGIHACDQYGMTALHSAAIKGHGDVVSLLVESGMDLECQDMDGHTPLHLAVEGGSLETVELLINAGANINTRTKRGATPLFMARSMGYDTISQLLLRRGAASASFMAPSSSPSSSSLTLCS